MELRDLPAVDELARSSDDPLAVAAARTVIDRAREAIRAGAEPGDLEARLQEELAALRAGAILIDAGSFAEASRRLEPLAANDRTFRHTARELLMLAAWRAGDATAAKRWSELIITDAQTPPGTRSRVEMLMALGAGQNKS